MADEDLIQELDHIIETNKADIQTLDRMQKQVNQKLLPPRQKVSIV